MGRLESLPGNNLVECPKMLLLNVLLDVQSKYTSNLDPVSWKAYTRKRFVSSVI